MSFGEDEEILQDFLVEAGEILDQLSEQLVDLEQRPDDRDLLNAIFRGFHTVKGGAGFLQLDEMVECCHITENLFDSLRNGKRAVTSALMDVVLQALDMVNEQFQAVSQRNPLPKAPQDLLDQLGRLVSGEDLEPEISTADQAPPPSVEPTSAESVPPSDEPADGLSLSDDEFEGLLDAVNEQSKVPTTQTPALESEPVSAPPERSVDSEGDEITEHEFEALLDQLHGKGGGPSQSDNAHKAPEPEKPSTASEHSVSGSDEISEDEFESLLDQLHGAGKAPSKETIQSVPKTPAANTSVTPPAAESSGVADPSELITDDEFESLLDELHGSGKGPTSTEVGPTPASKPPASPVSAQPPAPERKAPAVSSPREVKTEPSAPKSREAASGAGNAAAPSGETTVRVDTQRLDDIMNMVGELVLVRNRLVRLGLDSTDESLSKAVANLDVVTGDLQSAVMKTRMQPIKKVFGRFPRVVRDLARNLKKEINLELVGEETDLDKNLVEALADPLVHLVRNSVDHGIELPATREASGKSRVGKVILAAEQEGDHILLSIADDGGGMDPEKLREKAVEKGLYDQDAAARLSDVEAFNLIFAPGFSTKTEISDVSGRGVGMDVVKTKITQLNGSIEIQSKLGEGTRIVIKVPLTLAIMPTLMIMLGKQCFALPLVSVNEIFHMDLRKAHVVDGQECVTIREKAIPIFHLKRWLVNRNTEVGALSEAHVVIVTVGTRRVGFVVDQLIGQEEVVIKPLGKMLHGTPGMAGATITGDGTIALILDVPSLLKRYAGGI